MNDAIRKMTQTPGLHRVTNPMGKIKGWYITVEVEPNGTVHQLDFQGNRDGVLTEDGWVDDALVLQDGE